MTVGTGAVGPADPLRLWLDVRKASDQWSGPEDFTCYGPSVDPVEKLPPQFALDPTLASPALDASSSGGPVDLEGDVACHETYTGADCRLRGRGLLCRAYGGRLLALTIRVNSRDSSGELLSPRRSNSKRLETGYVLGNDPKPPFLCTPAVVCAALSETIGTAQAARGGGLIILTGGTGSLKSQMARGLVHEILGHQQRAYRGADTNPLPAAEPVKSLRRPHLLTIENPIEVLYVRDPHDAVVHGFEYTPRQIGVDTRGLAVALRSALRQTPSIVYVGEVRQPREWRHVVDFAGSGHLVVATGHAGSLREAISRLFRSANAHTPAARGEVASRVIAVVHLRRCEVSSRRATTEETRWGAVIPSVWRRSAASIAMLVNDGLSSILPHRPPKEILEGDVSGTIGRLWFWLRMRKLMSDRLDACDAMVSPPDECRPEIDARRARNFDNGVRVRAGLSEVERQVHLNALRWDLAGE
jgi:hypothetical protein